MSERVKELFAKLPEVVNEFEPATLYENDRFRVLFNGESLKVFDLRSIIGGDVSNKEIVRFFEHREVMDFHFPHHYEEESLKHEILENILNLLDKKAKE